MPTPEQPSDAAPPAPPAPDVPAAPPERPVAAQKPSEHLRELAESISKPLVAAVSGLAGMLTSLRDQLKDIDPETLRLLREIPILKWFIRDPDAPTTAGTDIPETPEAVAEKIQKAIVEIKKTNTDLGKKLDAKLAKVTALTDATEKQNGLTILEKDCEFIAVASGVIGDAKIGQVPEEKRGPLKFEDRLSKILADFPLEETDLTKATEKRETAHAVLTTLEADVDLAVKIATHVPEAERDKFYTCLATISAAHGEGKVDDVATDFRALQTEVGAFETQEKQAVSAEDARREANRILLDVFGLSAIWHDEAVEIEQWKITDLCGANPQSAGDDEQWLWGNIGSSDAAVAWPMVHTIQNYVVQYPGEIPYNTNTTLPQFLTDIVKNPAALSHLKECMPRNGKQWFDAGVAAPVSAPSSVPSAETPPPAA